MTEFPVKFINMNIIFTLLIALVSLTVHAQDEMYYVSQHDVVLSKSGSYVQVNKKCYRSKLQKRINNEFVIIKTDSVQFNYFLLRRENNKKNSTAYYAAKKDEVYYVREIHHQGEYYLTINPIKLHLSQKVNGTGIALTISTDKNICNCDNSSQQIQASTNTTSRLRVHR